MNESAVRVITREEMDTFLADIRHAAGRICGMYARGLLVEEEMRSRFSRLLLNDIPDFMDSKSLRLRVSARDWPVFLSAVSTWRSDGLEHHLRACSWLFFFRADENRGIRYGDEASVDDNLQVLRLLDACRIPVEYYRPVPEGIICPDLHPAHFPGEYFVGFEIWNQDGGLSRGDCRIGETKTLVDHHGLKAVIRIEEHTPEAEQDRCHDADYVGSGTIEGYTSSRPGKSGCICPVKEPPSSA